MISPHASHAATRVRVMRGRLLGPEMVPALLGERGLKTLGETLTDAGLAEAGAEVTSGAAWRRYGDRIAALARLYPDRPELFSSLLGLDEVANLLAVWRATARGRPGDWSAAWVPFGAAATLDPETLTPASTLAEVVQAVAPTPYGPGTARAWRAHREDPEAAELALERSARRRALEAAGRLGPGDAGAAALMRDRVIELEVRTLHSAVQAHGLRPAAAAALTDVLPTRLGPGRLEALARWRPGDPAPPLPPRLLPPLEGVDGPEGLHRRWGARRRAACLSAFVTGGLGMAPAVALALLARAEAEALVAAVEAGGAERVRPLVREALTPAWLGSPPC